MIKYEIDDTKFEVHVEASGAGSFYVDDKKVSRDDYLAILATVRTGQLQMIAHALDQENEHGIAGDLNNIKEALTDFGPRGGDEGKGIGQIVGDHLRNS